MAPTSRKLAVEDVEFYAIHGMNVTKMAVHIAEPHCDFRR